MQYKTLSFLTFLFLLGGHLSGQGTWTQKTNFGGGPRLFAVGFSIGNKGYIGTGTDGVTKNDFWEYDPSTDIWTQKANFPGVDRNAAIGLSIGSKGYIGLGSNNINSIFYSDFWEYDPITNTWTQKANFGGGARLHPAGFSIGSKGYIGTGFDGNNYADFWEWDQITNVWTQKANFGGGTIRDDVGFSIGTKGYIGTGYNGACQNGFWEWDQTTNMWTQKANVGGTVRHISVGFSIGTKGYIGTGNDCVIWGTQDFWEWDQSTNIWTQKANVGGGNRGGAVGFSIGCKGYIGTGGNGTFMQDFWEYSLDTLGLNTISSPSSCNNGTATALPYNGTPPYTFSWSNGQTLQTAVNLSGGTYIVIVSDNSCRSQTQTVSIQTIYDPCCNSNVVNFLPNAFSPNDDGENDQLCVPQNPCFDSFVLKIYDRWGEKVFESNSYQKCWDGTYKDKLLNTGVFIYYFNIIMTDDSRKEMKGNISLIR